MPRCDISDCAQMSKTIIAVWHFGIGGRESLEIAVKTGCNNVVGATLFNVVNNIVLHCYARFRLNKIFNYTNNAAPHNVTAFFNNLKQLVILGKQKNIDRQRNVSVTMFPILVRALANRF